MSIGEKIYPDKDLLSYIKREIRYIPRNIYHNEYLKLYHRYFLYDIGIVKVIYVDIINGIEYYYIRYRNKLSCITYPVNNFLSFELLHNNKEIEKKSIINSIESFTGAEIKFWFTINEENISKEILNGFLSFLEYNSNNSLSDSKYYHVFYDKNRTQKISVILDKNKFR